MMHKKTNFELLNQPIEISNCRVISTLWLTSHTNPSRKQSCSIRLFKTEEFENSGFRFRVDGKHFENGAF